jgi:SAM-dependent methyltransferase
LVRPALLEIGCGTGVFLDVAREAGWEVSGIEVSSYAVQQARGRGLSVDVCPIESSPLWAATYDCIALWDVIEHLRDPAGVLIQAGQALRPGGILALSTGDITSLSARLSGPGWHLFTVPEHLYFFSPAALEQLLRRAGCRIVQTTREVIWVPVAYLLERLRKTRVLPEPRRSRRAGLPRGLKPAARDWLVPATLLDVLGLYARRI